MKIFPIGTSRLHEPLGLISDNVNFPSFGYFHSPTQIKDLLSILLGERHLSVAEARFFFRKDQTPHNKFQSTFWQEGLASKEAFQKARLMFEDSDVVIVEISSIKSFMVNGLAVQGNPNFYHNIPYKDIWNRNYYEDYHPEVSSCQVTDESEVVSLFEHLSNICSLKGKRAIVLGHLVDPKQPNTTRKTLNTLLAEAALDFAELHYFDTEHLVDEFGFRILENGTTDIHHLPWDGLEVFSKPLLKVAREMCTEKLST